ncbi:MAG: hypothetical protein PHC88_02440 [Terrimicrobiaceae bacterium]|nr:hypothetical protein [Terrimicrobiaceae bacterium]
MVLPRSGFLFVLLVAFGAGCQRPPPADPRLQAPTGLMHEASARGLKNIFANPRAQPALRGRSLALAPATGEDAAAVQSPTLWRKLDRARRFDAVLLAGPVGEFLPLLTHLAASPDFHLVRADNWGALFIREPSAPYTPPEVNSISKDFPNANDRGIYLSQMALTLDAIGEVSAARAYSTAAINCAPRQPVVHIAAAALALSHKEYPRAVQHAGRALELHPHDPAALEVEARALAAAGAVEEAWVVANELKARAAPDDLNALFLHARLANAAHAYGAEQDSLERLVHLAEERKLPASDYRVYLGQCYARQGLARPALDQLDLASKDPNLTAKERADLDTAIETVRKRAGTLNN